MGLHVRLCVNRNGNPLSTNPFVSPTDDIKAALPPTPLSPHLSAMCGRFTNLLTWRELVALYRLSDARPAPNWPARYNIAPTQEVPVVRLAGGDDPAAPDAAAPAAAREIVPLRWGLVPAWAADAKIGYATINARAETVEAKPAFRAAFARRRCLVPASGYYEWKPAVGPGGAKRPIYFTPAPGEPPAFSFAGLWERWEKAGTVLETFTIVVGPGNALARTVHDRMPVILDAADHDTWLAGDAAAAKALLRPYPAERMQAFAVGRRVGNVRHDDASLIEPLGEAAEAGDPPPSQGRLV